MIFLLVLRAPLAPGSKRERISVHWTNLALLGIGALMAVTIGLKSYLMIQLPVMALASAAGVWLFNVQHQFEGTYWERHVRWDFVTAALAGSSYYQLPAVLRWFSGNIGYHHIHHLGPRIPNYILRRCRLASAVFGCVRPLTIRMSLKSLGLHLWDEERCALVGFSAARM